METIHQEQSPTVSSVEQQKMEAGKFVAQRIDALMKNDATLSVLNAARQVYEEVRGQNYREEQASAKLLEYLTMQNEVGLRGLEIINTYKDLSPVVEQGVHATVVQGKEAANDERYSVIKEGAA